MKTKEEFLKRLNDNEINYTLDGEDILIYFFWSRKKYCGIIKQPTDYSNFKVIIQKDIVVPELYRKDMNEFIRSCNTGKRIVKWIFNEPNHIEIQLLIAETTLKSIFEQLRYVVVNETRNFNTITDNLQKWIREEISLRGVASISRIKVDKKFDKYLEQKAIRENIEKERIQEAKNILSPSPNSANQPSDL